jgi:tRNA modification GTPase
VTRVAFLTPPGTGAIATVEVSGPRAWEFARRLFRPAGKPLPELPEVHRFWFGTLGGDEVILAVTGESTIEVHCHGGVRVVRWVVEQFVASGGREPPVRDLNRGLTPPTRLLQHAPTLRTASILLDQCHGAFQRAIQRVIELLDDRSAEACSLLGELARYAPSGRHLVEPWKVVVAGAPNVGKSSLVNALAGFQRAVVSEVAGTTRDVVTVQLALDGWPVELTDTAGLREAEGLEAEGVERANRALAEADLVLWVVDRTDPSPRWPTDRELANRQRLWVANKADLPAQRRGEERDVLAVSAATGFGISELIAAMVGRFVPASPPPGAAMPFSPELADRIEAANAALVAGRVDEAARLLREALD